MTAPTKADVERFLIEQRAFERAAAVRFCRDETGRVVRVPALGEYPRLGLRIAACTVLCAVVLVLFKGIW